MPSLVQIKKRFCQSREHLLPDPFFRDVDVSYVICMAAKLKLHGVREVFLGIL